MRSLSTRHLADRLDPKAKISHFSQSISPISSPLIVCSSSLRWETCKSWSSMLRTEPLSAVNERSSTQVESSTAQHRQPSRGLVSRASLCGHPTATLRRSSSVAAISDTASRSTLQYLICHPNRQSARKCAHHAWSPHRHTHHIQAMQARAAPVLVGPVVDSGGSYGECTHAYGEWGTSTYGDACT